MKRIILLALTLAVSASFFTASADKKEKNKKQQPKAAALSLATPSDSVSYAAGMALTDGLLPFLKQQYGVDEAFLDDFLRGFTEAMKADVDDAIKAYGAGIQVATMLQDRMLPDVKTAFADTPDSIQPALLSLGFTDALRKDTTFFKTSEASKLFSERQEAANARRTEAAIKAGADFLEANKQKEGVHTTASGLQYKVLTQGTGDIPEATSSVSVQYEGRLIDGTVFDSSYERHSPANFRVNQVIKGWTEALTMMPVGSKWELYIPQNLAYGERQTGKIPPYSTLIFTVELLGINP